jgi:beta-galactosidase GanA
MKLMQQKNIQFISMPAQIEVVIRSRGEEKFYFYMNHGDVERKVALAEGTFLDLITGMRYHGVLPISHYGVHILQREESRG